MVSRTKEDKKKSGSIALYAQTKAAAEERSKRLGFKSLSEYIETLIECDLRERPSFVRDENGAYFTNMPPPKTTEAGEAVVSKDVAPPSRVLSDTLDKFRKTKPTLEKKHDDSSPKK